MKRKKHNPKQWSFERCIEFAINGLGEEDRKALIEGMHFDWHSTFGRWIRNECGLWKHGTDRCVADIVQEYKAGRLTSKYLDENRFTHHELPFDLMNIDNNPVWTTTGTTGRIKILNRVDCTLVHPDNCSAVIIETVIQRLRDGN